MNWLAKDREWLVQHYGFEIIVVPHYRTKVLTDGTTREIIDVTIEELLLFLAKG
jgi:hypothetical protein